jgi:hypothetical protein
MTPGDKVEEEEVVIYSYQKADSLHCLNHLITINSDPEAREIFTMQSIPLQRKKYKISVDKRAWCLYFSL